MICSCRRDGSRETSKLGPIGCVQPSLSTIHRQLCAASKHPLGSATRAEPVQDGDSPRTPLLFRGQRPSIGHTLVALQVFACCLMAGGCANSGRCTSAPVSALPEVDRHNRSSAVRWVPTEMRSNPPVVRDASEHREALVRAPYGLLTPQIIADGTPPALLPLARMALNDEIWRISVVEYGWLSKSLFMVTTSRGKTGIFMEKSGGFAHVNSGRGLTAINEILQEYHFARDDFSDPERVYAFLKEVTFLRTGPRLIPCSSVGLRKIGPIRDWLKYLEDEELVIRELCEDPVFAFHGSTWTVVFNVMLPDGGVDQWTVTGVHDLEANVNQILSVGVCEVKPADTFHYPLLG